MRQIIIHVDMDAFYASVEVRDDPRLRGKPLIIGSMPNERGVVATCSYEARKYGVRSGMNIKEAYRLCPGGIYMHPNFNKYRAVSQQLHDIWNTYAAASQTIALDEAYLDVTEKAKDWEGARKIAHLIKQRTQEELHLTCSVGVAYSKTAAKTASEEKKPDGYFEILTAQAFVDLVIDRDVRVLYTVGAKTAERLHRAGIDTVRDIRDRHEEVEKMLGKHGRWLTRLAFGIDDSRVTPYRPEDAKSIGREVTFQQDVSDLEVLKDVLMLLCFCVEHRAQRVGLKGKGISLKLTYGDMKAISRSHTSLRTDDAALIYDTAEQMLEQVEHRPVRLIGVGLYNLSGEEEPVQLTFDDISKDTSLSQSKRSKMLEHLKARYRLDFAGNLDKIYQWDTLHRTIEYIRKYKR
ncbi:MAG: DNA polymerase IV [Ruminococcus sp.]|nr:DNA polymerase IV [Ruminococcus sp.]